MKETNDTLSVGDGDKGLTTLMISCDFLRIPMRQISRTLFRLLA